MSLKRTGAANTQINTQQPQGGKKTISILKKKVVSPPTCLSLAPPSPLESTWTTVTPPAPTTYASTLDEMIFVSDSPTTDPTTMTTIQDDNLAFETLFETSINTPEVPNEEKAFNFMHSNSVVQQNEELVFDVSVPVVDVNTIWTMEQVKEEKVESTLAMEVEEKMMQVVDPMACFNPFVVEGKKTSLPKLSMPSGEVSDDLSTPTVSNMLEANAGFDLLEFVTNTELPLNDPEFMAMIADDDGSNNLDTINTEDLVVAPKKGVTAKKGVATKKGKGGKAGKKSQIRTRGKTGKTSTVTSSSFDHTYNDLLSSNLDTDSSESSYRDEDQKYRRMRDLNNLASKRCRQNRKRKFQGMMEEEDMLRKRNAELRMRCGHLEEMVGKLKKRFIERVSNPKPKAKVSLEQLLGIE